MSELAPLGEFVRRRDPDRFLTSLFAPAERRATLWALYAFNHEIARAREAARDPTLALIRLQWWREVVEGARRSHEVALPLSVELDAGRLDAAALLALIDARDEETVETFDDWQAWLRRQAGGLAVAAARVLGRGDEARLEALGTAYGAAGLLRSIPALARQGRCLLPADLLAEAGLSADAVLAQPQQAGLAPVVDRLAVWARELLGKPAALDRDIVPAALVGVLARRDLSGDRVRQARVMPGRGVGDRLAVLVAALRRRV